MTSVPSTIPTVEQLREAILALPDPAKHDLAASWPAGVPGLKNPPREHTPEERARIHEAIAAVAHTHDVPALPRVPVDEIRARYDQLAPDLQAHVDDATRGQGMPQLAGRTVVPSEHAAAIETALAQAEEIRGARRARAHAALTAAGLNESDEFRHHVVWQLTGRVETTNLLTQDELEHLVAVCTRAELAEGVMLTFADDGRPVLVDGDTNPIVPLPVERDWRAWCKEHGKTQKATLTAAEGIAAELALPVPKKLDEITHPAVVAGVERELGTSAEKPRQLLGVAPAAPVVTITPPPAVTAEQPAPAPEALPPASEVGAPPPVDDARIKELVRRHVADALVGTLEELVERLKAAS